MSKYKPCYISPKDKIRMEQRRLFNIRKTEIEVISGTKIVKTLAAGDNSSWSYRPGGEGIGFDSDSNVVEFLENKYLNK